MICWGRTSKGKTRWRCKNCKLTEVRKRKDTINRNIYRLFKRWVLEMVPIKNISKVKKISKRTLIRKFELCWKVKVPILFPALKTDPVLIIDGTAISKDCIVLIVYDAVSKQPLNWSFTGRESYFSWHSLLSEIKKKTDVKAIVSDGQKGLKKAVNELFPHSCHQRCMTHVIRLSLAWLTKNPRTEAGVNLRKIVRLLSKVKTEENAIVWKKLFQYWNLKYQPFLKEKSVNFFGGNDWYTHRKLRAVNSLISGAVNNLFFYLDDATIPNTTNFVEGGINSPLSELIRRHRGLSAEKKKALVSLFLTARQNKKSPTLFVT